MPISEHSLAVSSQPRNEHATALYSGTIAAWLEKNAHNRADRGHDQGLACPS